MRVISGDINYEERATCELVNQDSLVCGFLKRVPGAGGTRQNQYEDSSRVRSVRPGRASRMENSVDTALTRYTFYAVAVIVPVFEEKGFTRIIRMYLKIW